MKTLLRLFALFLALVGTLPFGGRPILAQETKATVFIYWPKKNQLTGDLPIFCNRIELGKMGRGRYMQVLLSPGLHVFEVGLRGLPIEVELTTGARKYFRIDWPKGGWHPMPFFRRPKLLPASEADGAAELRQLAYVKPEKIKDPALVRLSADDRRRIR